MAKEQIYGVSSKFEFGVWNHVVYHFEDMETAEKWLNTEEYDFREREIMSKTAAIKLAGKKAVDNAIKDIQDSNRRLILESTGLQQTLEDMIKQRQEAQEKKFTDEITKKESLQDLLDFQAEDAEVETENDSDALSVDFTEENDASNNSPVVVKPKEEHSNE